MRFMLVVLTTILFSFQIFAADKVRMTDDDEPVIRYGLNSTTIEPHTTSGGDGTIQSSRFKTYIPVNSSGTVSGGDSGLFNINSAASLPTDTGGTGIDGGHLRFDILYTADQAGTLYALVSNEDSGDSTPTDGDWIVYYPLSIVSQDPDSDQKFSVSASSTDVTDSVFFDLTDFCSSTFSACGSFTGAGTELRQIYLFVTDDDLVETDTSINPSDYSNGIYIEVALSDDPPDNVTPSINSIDRGDSSLTINYTSSSITNFLEVRACVDTSSFTGNQSIEAASCDISDQVFDPNTNGSVTISDLANSTPYFLGVVLVNNWHFGTELSNVESETPLEIETLLDETQCFIVTATQGRDNYILKRLRRFRDEFLVDYGWGRKIIDFYYELSPPLAKLILKNDILKMIFRPIVYLFYVMVEYFWFVMSFFLIFFVLLFSLSRIKNKGAIHGRP